LAGSGNPFSIFEEIIGILFGLFAISDEDSVYTTSVPAAGGITGELPPSDQVEKNNTPIPTQTPLLSDEPLFSLMITTDPLGGSVLLDRMDMGVTTPLNITDLDAGIHTLDISLDGYEPVYRTVDLVNDTHIDVVLVTVEKESTIENGNTADTSPCGGLFVDSYPEWATIKVDGRVANGVTPYVITGLKTGAHTVQVSKEGIVYTVSKRQVTVNNGTISIVRFNNEPTILRSISFASDVYRGDSCTVNGMSPAIRIPQKITVEGTGAFITVRHNASYRAWQISDYLPNGETMALLPSDMTFATVMITSDPVDSDIFMDGFLTGLKTPALVANISSGQHRVAISRMGYVPQDQVFTVVDDPARETDLTIHLEMEPFMHGSLTVTSSPPDAKIFIDGSDTRQRTPYTFTFLSAGSYELKITDGNKTKNADVDIFPDEERVYRIDFINDSLDTWRQPIRE
jgi:hypothetical protein